MAINIPKLKVAVAGTSFGGNVQIPVFQSHPRTEVVAVSSGRAERAELAARQHGIPAHFTNFEEMLDKTKPDLVSIVTPPGFHFPMTMGALRRGIHVLCEKPFAMNVAEARQMKTAAENSKAVAMIDFEFRFLPARAYAADLIRQGYIGEIRMADFLVHFGIRTNPDDIGWDWWSDSSQGGGLLGAFGSHVLDMLRLMMGEPRRVFCDLVTFVRQRSGRNVTSDDSYTLILQFESGARAVVQMSVASGVHDARFGIHGTAGQLTIPNLYATELHGAKREEKLPHPIEIPEHYRLAAEAPPLRPAFRALLNRLVQAIDTGSPSPSPNFDDGLVSQAILDAARRSAKDGLWVDIA